MAKAMPTLTGRPTSEIPGTLDEILTRGVFYLTRKQIAFLPYVEAEYFQFGKLHFWSYQEFKEKKEIPTKYLKFLDWYLHKFVDEKQKPLKVTLLSFSKDTIIGNWNDKQTQEMYDTVGILNFLSIYNNIEFSPVSSDNFILYIKNFKPEDKSLAISEGSYININKYYSGEVTDNIIYVKPNTIPDWGFNKQPWESDKELFDGFSNALKSQYRNKWFKRVLSSIKIYNTTNVNSINLGIYDRILILVTAFESLFEESTQSQNKFSKAILDNIGLSNSYNESNKKIKSFSKKLYKLRSRYSHGESLGKKYIHPEYGDFFKVGLYLFSLLIKNILRNKGLINQKDEYERYIKEISFGLFAKMESTMIKS